MRALLALTAMALPAAAQDAPEGLTATYACAGGVALQVAYINAPEASYAVVAWDGRLVPMKSGPTGSGVRYLSLDEPEALVWHVKGDDGFLARDADMAMLLTDCVAHPG